MTNTINLDLERPDRGDSGWGVSMNSNMTKLDTGYGNNVSTIADLPQVYIETGTFNYTTGDTITLPVAVDATNEYSVKVTPTSRAGAIGDIYVTKTTTNFIVHCSSDNTADTFEAVIYYIGDINSYGGSIYRRWYVSPDASITDHGDDTDEGSFAWVLDQITASAGVGQATVELPGNKTYTITTATAVPDDVIVIPQKGAIFGGAGTLTFNSADQIDARPTQQIFGSSITIAFTNPGIVYPEWWGATGDGSTDDSTEIQACIDALETPKGGTVQFLSRTYVCNIEAKSYVELRGAVPMFRGSSTGTTSHSNTYLKANATGHIITTAAGAVSGIAVRNIGFIGLGSAVPLKGLYLQNVNRSFFEDLAFDNIADEAIRINDGNPNHFNRIFAQNCLLNRTQAAKIGVFHIEVGADDQWVSQCEFAASSTSLSDANAYICAMVVDASNCLIDNVIASFADIAIYVGANGGLNRFSNCRGELCYSHGWEILGGSNQFENCVSLSNGHETDNTYSGVWNSGGGNMFGNFLSRSYTADSEKHKYGFYDNTNSVANRSFYSLCKSVEHQTMAFYANPNYGVSPLWTDQGLEATTADDATPSVAQYSFFDVKAATGALNITNFDDGTPGQVIYVADFSANGYVTIVHNTSNIVTLSGDNILMLYRKIYAFKLYNSVWYELGDQQFGVDVTAAGAGTDGTISSRSASALGECDGFLKLYKSDGTLVYVPYWEDITP